MQSMIWELKMENSALLAQVPSALRWLRYALIIIAQCAIQ